MVLSHNLQDVFEASCKFSLLSLPTLKDIGLDIHFSAIDVNNATTTTTVYNGPKPILPFASSEPFEANIIDWRYLSSQDKKCKAVYEITFDIAKSNFTFKPGDTIGILAQNLEEDVNTIINHLDLSSKANLQYTLSDSTTDNHKGCKIPPHIPVKSTIRYVLTSCCDIRAVPKKIFLLALSRHTKDEDERKILEYLCSKEGSIAYNSYVLDQQLCLLDLLIIFKSCKPPIQVLLGHLPRLLPRPYSIVNSSVKNPNVVKICFSVMDLGHNRKGLVTGWLENKIKRGTYSIEEKMRSLNLSSELEKVSIYLRRNISGFTPPVDLKTPLILIATGTGIAPFIGFLEQRSYLKESSQEVDMGTVWLFFGCRHPNSDFIYEKELNMFLNNKTIDRFNKSFSRMENAESKYVQDALMHNGEDLVRLIERGASIFICGDLKNMAVAVKDTIINCLVKYSNKSQEESKSLLSNMQTEKKYLVDIWS
ncbi:unnamed protein product [Diatraea saccharalis]|uniref:Methionine synthase reductase n=1 Tax=Diatraea saccharalis TaxID=40085 RepID=A0A9N9WB26_9NEOP|nr:unnamed protein product [Diatraea saccharalis]